MTEWVLWLHVSHLLVHGKNKLIQYVPGHYSILSGTAVRAPLLINRGALKSVGDLALELASKLFRSTGKSITLLLLDKQEPGIKCH